MLKGDAAIGYRSSEGSRDSVDARVHLKVQRDEILGLQPLVTFRHRRRSTLC